MGCALSFLVVLKNHTANATSAARRGTMITGVRNRMRVTNATKTICESWRQGAVVSAIAWLHSNHTKQTDLTAC